MKKILTKEVNFQLAVLLREKGFNTIDKEIKQLINDTRIISDDIYFSYYVTNGQKIDFEKSEIRSSKSFGLLADYDNKLSADNPYKWYLAPTISEVVDWLYETYGVWIWVSLELGYETTFCWQLTGENISSNYKPYFKSQSEAYENAIEYFLINF